MNFALKLLYNNQSQEENVASILAKKMTEFQ